jgi:hypothetical protein
MEIFAATPSEADKKYISGIHPTTMFITGRSGMWVVWDVKVGQSGYFARLVPESSGKPLGFHPCEINGEVWGYSRQ